MIYNNILELIGNTPLVKINKLNPNPQVILLAKLEFFNPGGSIKDRIGLAMIESAEKRKILLKNCVVIEATGAGNTGLGLAITSAVKGYKTVLVIPDKVSEEKRNLLRAYGAKVVVTPTAVLPEDERSYYKVTEKLIKEIPKAHYMTTGPEIWKDTAGKVTHVIVGMGTGGTSGAALYAAQKVSKNLKKGLVVAVFPDSGRSYLSKFYNDEWMKNNGSNNY